ncbi:MAG: hypothetical protein CMI17_01670 [Opitutaceae bacterium]|nr:hypothetical protein [Opitutaceae bacterium]
MQIKFSVYWYFNGVWLFHYSFLSLDSIIAETFLNRSLNCRTSRKQPCILNRLAVTCLPSIHRLMKFWKTSITLATTILAATMVFSNQGENRNLLPPVPIYKVSPKHPDDLYASAIEGEAVIAVTVDIFGGTTKPKVETETHPDFGIAASQAASEWIFEPATKDGVPIESRVKLPFVFEIAFEHKFNVEMGREIFVKLNHTVVPSSELDKDPLPKYVPPFSDFYPENFRGSGKSASVNLEFIIAPNGEVLNPHILTLTTNGFEKAALQAISSMKYPPVVVDGKPAYVHMIRPIQLTE